GLRARRRPRGPRPGAGRRSDARARRRLPDADEAADHAARRLHHAGGDGVGRGGSAAARADGRDAARHDARLRRRERAEPRLGPRHRPADDAHGDPSDRRRTDRSPVGRDLRRRAERGRRRAPDRGRESARRRARHGGQPLLRRRLHDGAEAADAPEHRHRRRRGGRATAGGLGRGDRRGGPRAAPHVPDHLLLDAAALLGARHPRPPGVRAGRDPDAARRPQRARDGHADPRLHGHPGRRLDPALHRGAAGPRLPRLGHAARAAVPAAVAPADARPVARRRPRHVPVVARLPGAALHGHGPRPGTRRGRL
ncbi:MAG: Heme O synthase, protoheme IX farnesyltransferase COX10-CtaB, partial [uncultured Thermoleophilia bacterium]